MEDPLYFDEAREILAKALDTRCPGTAEGIRECALNRMEMIAITSIAALLHMADTSGEVGLVE